MSLTNKVICKIKEIEKYQFVSLTLNESLGDVLPTGTLTFTQDYENEDLSVDTLSIELVISSEYQLSMKAFVEEANNYLGRNVWNLTFVPKEFYQDTHKQEFTGIKSLINNLCPYDLLSEVTTDTQLTSEKLYQNNISDFHCLSKYLRSMSLNYIYSYRFDGLELINLNNKPKETMNIASVERFLKLKVSRNKFKDMKATSGELGTNELTNIHYNNSVICLRSVFAKAYMNYLENSNRFKALEDKISYDFPDFMNLRAGDLIKLTGTKFENNNYIVTDNLLELTAGNVTNKLKFSAI